VQSRAQCTSAAPESYRPLTHLDITQEIILAQPKGRLRVATKINKNIAVLHLVPGNYPFKKKE
jgi:hypothetical protein